MKKIIFLILLSIFSISLWSQVINVPQDQSTIQKGINAASDGDTILVAPGTYSENINFDGKNITVASYYLTTQDISYISQTMIDGTHDGSVVTFENGEDSTAMLCGFKLMNGVAGEGAGIYCTNANPVLRNLIIEECIASQYYWGSGGGASFRRSEASMTDVIISKCMARYYGGGIIVEDSSIVCLKNVTIKENETSGSYYWGGTGAGIYCSESFLTLDNVDISFNYSGETGGITCSSSTVSFLNNTRICYNSGNYTGGLFIADDCQVVFDSVNRCSIYLNESTAARDIRTSVSLHVVLDTFTVAIPTARFAKPLENFTWDILNGLIQQENADLFVSPYGSDENSGLTADEPLKTIDMAQTKMLTDSLNPHTIYLSQGTFSPSVNGEEFPVTLMDYISLQGEAEGVTILDAEESSGVIVIADNNQSYLSNLILQNGISGDGGGIHCVNSSLLLEDIDVMNCSVNGGYYGGRGGGIYCSYSEVDMISVSISENGSNGWYVNGGGLFCSNSDVSMLDVIIENNVSESGGGICTINDTRIQMSSSTILNNNASGTGGGIQGTLSRFIFDDVDILYNVAYTGGGLSINGVDSLLSGMTVAYNQANYGGGLYCEGSEAPVFDTVNRCNIYLNRAFSGQDLYSYCQVHVAIDTFSVLVPTSFYATPLSSFSFDILNGKIEQVNASLYVSPSGSDDNSGLTQDDPLRTIHYANQRILADSLHPQNIYLLEGIFSTNTNNEFFPVIPTDHTTIVGSDDGTTILDAEETSDVIWIVDKDNVSVRNMTIRGSGRNNTQYYQGHGIHCVNSNVVLDELVMRENLYAGIYMAFSTGSLKNLDIVNNPGDGIIISDSSDVQIESTSISQNGENGMRCYSGSSIEMNNVIVSGNTHTGILCNGSFPVMNNVDISNNQDGGISLNNTDALIRNSLINNNYSYRGGGIYSINSHPVLRNVTIRDNNSYREGSGILCDFGSYLEMDTVQIISNISDFGDGGGICFNDNSTGKLEEVVFESNIADNGGAIFLNTDLIVSMKNVRITDNVAYNTAGGIFITAPTHPNLAFDTLDRCTIHSNIALQGADLVTDYQGTKIVLDTFTVLYPNDYHAFPIDSFEFDIRHGLVDQVDADLYVSPSGNDQRNNGLTKNDPLKTIRHAVSRQIFDSLHQHNVYLLPGTYGPSTTGEVFPFQIPNYFNLTGTNERFVILDAGGAPSCLIFNSNSTSITSGFTVKGSGGPGYNYRGIYLINSNPELHHLTISHNQANGIYCEESDPFLHHLTVKHNGEAGMKFRGSNPRIDSVLVAYNNGDGIRCENGASPIIEHTTISHNGGRGLDCWSESHPLVYHSDIIGNAGGGVSCENDCSPLLYDISIKDNSAVLGGGIECNRRCNPSIQFVEIDGNEAQEGAGIYCAASSSPFIYQTSITNNVATNIGGGLCIRYTDPVLEDVIISGNMALDGGGIYSKAYPYPSFTNVSITGNTAIDRGGGIYMFYNHSAMNDMLIAGNRAKTGGGIHCEIVSSPMLTNATITDNYAEENGGGIYCSQMGEPVLTNSIMWNNTPEEIWFNPEKEPSTVTVSWSDIEGGENGIITNDNGEVNWLEENIDSDPLFTGTGDYPCQLSALSPCINTGNPDTLGLNLPLNDLVGNLRIWDDVVDMGAFEWNNVGIEEEQYKDMVHGIRAYPNPFSLQTTIKYELSVPEHVMVEIIDLCGKKICTLEDAYKFQGRNEVIFNGSDLIPGIYLCSLKTGNSLRMCKIIKF